MTTNCSSPGSLTNGFFVIAKNTYVSGDKIYYYCMQDYYLQGNPIRECDSSGNWTGGTPTCTQDATTTTTVAPDSNEWLYMSIGLSGFLALFLLLVLFALILHSCTSLCRQISKVNENEEITETGCCLYCCVSCENGCKPRVQVKPKKKKTRTAGIQTYDVNFQPNMTTTVPKRTARQIIDDWKPSRNPFRDNNTSTN